MKFKFKELLIQFLELLKSNINFNTSAVLLIFLLVCEFFFFNKSINKELLNITLSIFIPYFYIIFLYFIMDIKKSKLLLKRQNIFQYYITKNEKYFRKQFKDVFIEEFLFRYLPLLVATLFCSDSVLLIGFLILTITVVFTLIHEFNHWFLILEFFFFFLIIFTLFAVTKDFNVLFFPHLIRNLMIQYLIKNKS